MKSVELDCCRARSSATLGVALSTRQGFRAMATRVLPGLGTLVLAVGVDLGCGSAALADDPLRYVPALGSSYVYLTTVETFRDGLLVNSDQTEFVRLVTASDGANAEIRSTIRSMHGTKVDQLSVNDKQLYLSMMSVDYLQTYRYFQTRKMTFTSWPLAVQPDGQLPPLYALGSAVIDTQCDDALLASFLPMGHVPKIVVPCQVNSAFKGDARPSEQLQLTIAFEGNSLITLRAGTFAVRNLRFTFDYTSGRRIDASVVFSDQLGLALLTDIVQDLQIGGSVARTTSHSELVEVGDPP